MSTATVSADNEAVAAISAPTVVSGTFTLYMTKSYVIQALAQDIIITPANPWAHSTSGDTTATTWQITGGDFDLRAGTGELHLDGGIIITHLKSGQSMVLMNMRFNLATHTIDYDWKTPDGDAPVPGLDAGSGQGGVWGSSGSYTAAEVFVNRDSGAFMNDFLKSTAFVDEGLFGAIATKFELKEAAPTEGVVEWGKK